MSTHRSSFWAWAQLLRLPNLFTLPGDAIAGGALASLSAPTFAWYPALSAAVAVTLLYMGGLLLNDYFDWEEDLHDRPDRPLPSGAVLPTSVLIMGFWCLLVGILIAWYTSGIAAAVVALAIAAAATLYDTGGKTHPLIGPILMATCRCGSVFLGATAVGYSGFISLFLTLGAATAQGVFIFCLTRVAAKETALTPPKSIELFAPSILCAGVAGIVLVISSSRTSMVAWTLWGVALAEGIVRALTVRSQQLPLPPFVGQLIRTLLTWQALWIVIGFAERSAIAGVLVVLCLGLTRLAADRAARRFYGS